MSKRFDYVKYDEAAIAKQADFKASFKMLEMKIENIGHELPFDLKPIFVGRAKSLALTALEECYMWIGKGLRDEQLYRNSQTHLQEEKTNS